MAERRMVLREMAGSLGNGQRSETERSGVERSWTFPREPAISLRIIRSEDISPRTLVLKPNGWFSAKPDCPRSYAHIHEIPLL